MTYDFNFIDVYFFLAINITSLKHLIFFNFYKKHSIFFNFHKVQLNTELNKKILWI